MFVGPVVTGSGDSGGIYYKAADGTAKYEYSLQDRASTLTAWLGQTNSMGGNGYRFKAPYGGGGNLYVKETGATKSFYYSGRSLQPGIAIADLTNELNAEGAKGNRWLGQLALQGGSVHGFVADSSTPNATYTYSYELDGVGIDSLLTRINDMGAQGAQYLGTYQVGGQAYRMFETSSLQTTPVSYTATAVGATETLSAMVTDLNEKAANGSLFWSDVAFPTQTATGAIVNVTYRLYAKGLVSPTHPLTGAWYPK